MQNAQTTFKPRKHERRPCSRVIDYSLINSDSGDRKLIDLKGKAVDISEGGVGLQTDYPLEPGHMVWFNDGIAEKAGLVKWSERFEDGYRVGIELDEKHVKTLDEATDVFIERLVDIENRCLNPEEGSEHLLREIVGAITRMSSAYEEFEREVKVKSVILNAQIRFREKTDRLLSKSYFINRARTWPKGYQGDFKMLESIYRNTPLSEGIGYLLDLYFLGAPLNRAATTRIKRLKELLSEELKERKGLSVMNIACGSCREVFELAAEIERSEATFTCIDLDDDALAFAANRLSYTGISPVSSSRVSLRKYNALRIFDRELNMRDFGRQDIIYSVGFFDYLPTDFLVNMLGALYDMLNSGGKLIAAFKDADRYRSIDRHWLVDWGGFLERKEEDFRNILHDAGIPTSALKDTRDDSGIIQFYIASK
jgi:extracellular factor (EF) 3-hydroxypalmitic acid methyl ester biosynthesis protein